MEISLNHKELKEINNFAVKYREEQVFMGLHKFNFKQIKLLVCEVRQQNICLSKYLIELEEFAGYFLNHYAVDDPLCFQIDRKLFRNIRKSYRFLIRTRFRFCPRSPYRKFNHLGEHIKYSTPSYSYLCGTQCVQLDLFGIKSYPQLVQVLCSSFSEFFSTLRRCAKLCKDVLNEEETIRNKPVLCRALYERDYQEILSQFRDIVKAFESIQQSGMIDVLGSDKDEVILNGFHKLTRNQMLAHVLHNEVRKATESELDEEERVLFEGQSVDFVKKVKYVIDNLDKLTAKGRGKAMPALTIAFLVERFQARFKNESAFHKYLKRKYSGSYVIPSTQAVNKAKNKKLSEDEKEKKRVFNENIDGLLASYVSTNKGRISQIPISPNGIYI